MHFMSIEVSLQEVLFIPHRPRGSITDLLQETATKKDLTEAPFSQNHLHDLESLWWVAVWIVFYNYILPATPSDDCLPFRLEDVGKHLKLAGRIFPSTLDDTKRRDCFQKSFLAKCDGLPENKTPMCNVLDALRLTLIDQYRIIESTLPQSFDLNSSTDDIYEDFKTGFSHSLTPCRNLELDFIQTIYVKLLNENENAGRSESTNDTGVAQKTPRRK
jgi:hypothetical protein